MNTFYHTEEDTFPGISCGIVLGAVLLEHSTNRAQSCEYPCCGGSAIASSQRFLRAGADATFWADPRGQRICGRSSKEMVEQSPRL